MKTTRTTFLLIALTGAALLAAPLGAQGMRRGQGMQRDPIEAFRQADRNGDGVVSRAEYGAARMERFDRLDRNGDGSISRADFGRLARIAPRIGRRIDTLLAQADRNHDGRVSREEMAASPMPLFDRLDANRDDRIDKAELDAARAHAEEIRQELETYER